MNLKTGSTLLISLASLFISPPVLAHGGGASKEEPPARVQARPTRVAAKKPSSLNGSDVERLSSSGYGSDALAVDCKLGEFTSCRGLDIALTDIAGNVIATGNTSTNGLVGFEGLRPGMNYIAKIESDRYNGSIQVQAGRLWSLNGERKQ